MKPRQVESGNPATPGTRGRAALLGPIFSRLPVLFAVGLAISLVMVARSQVSGDQLNMLARGWLFTHGEWVQFGMTTSANGKEPGGLISLLAGLPLLLWRDYRAPALLILASHALAYFLLDRTLRGILSARERLLFCVLYWLNPWRLYNSGYLWPANWLFIFGAVHLWTVYRQRREPSFWLSFLHALALAALVQVHASFFVLVLASVMLVLRGWFRPNWVAVALGAGVGALALIPWVEAVVANPALMPGSKGFPFRGLILVQPFLRGIAHWVQYASLSFTGDMTSFDFTSVLGSEDRWLGPSLKISAIVIGGVSAVPSVLAAAWMWRRNRRRWRLPPAGFSDRTWLHSYVVWTFAAAACSFALSPTTVMSWQGFSVLHAAVLPLVFWVAVLLRSRRRAVVQQLAHAWVAVLMVLLACMAVAAPRYRRGGREAETITVQRDHPMYHELGILKHTSVRVDPTRDWLPDMFHANPAEGR
jgi:hypothetical protein